ncbi:MAG TPA: hypothetical protein VK203_20540, partial [Nostocaceae cyanobacterium]|nr:hypothetical protein [Nostocaceae cyanobacterium]
MCYLAEENPAYQLEGLTTPFSVEIRTRRSGVRGRRGEGRHGEGRWGDGEMGRWGDGEMGRWGDG